MPVSDLLRAGVAALTPQQVADMALERDQATRRAVAANRAADAVEADREAAALAAIFRDER